MKRSSPLSRHTPLTADRAATNQFVQRGRRNAKQSRQAISPASSAQREKVGDLPCVVCGRDRFETRIEPAHLTSRALGGTDSPLDVVPICHEHHRRFDDGDLSILEYLEPAWRDEVAECVRKLGLIGALRRLTGERYELTRGER